MAQNASHAVMAQRHEPPSSLDDFPTPPWATRALCEKLKYRGRVSKGIVIDLHALSCWEPACGRGHMASVLSEYFHTVYATDIRDYDSGYRHDVLDFLDERAGQQSGRWDWIITNPPFSRAADFALRALELCNVGVALLVRTGFLESSSRYLRLFRKRPPTTVYQFVERVPMVRGRLDRTASTATAYCWIVWSNDQDGPMETVLRWTAPCRFRLERDEDYACCEQARTPQNRRR